MCQPCNDRALRMAPAVIEVPEDHENYKSGDLPELHWFPMGY